MFQVRPAGDEQLEVRLREGGGRHPVVVGLFQRRGVVPQGPRLEVGAIGGQADLDPPVRARRQVHRPDDAAHAAVGVLAHRVVNRGGGGGRVPDHPEVELDSARGPRAPQRNVAELHDLVAIDELVSRLLHHGPPHLPPRLGQHEDLDQVVLQLHDPPLARLRGGGVAAEGVVRVQAGVAGQDRNRIGLGERVGLDQAGLFGHAGLGQARGRPRPGQRDRGEQHEGGPRATPHRHGSDPGRYRELARVGRHDTLPVSLRNENRHPSVC